MKIIAGSLKVIEVFNGYTLYGKDMGGQDTFISRLGDTDLGYDPNDEPELELAYGFEIIPLEIYLVGLI